jgi:4-aminobutyrate aminotransferase
MAAMIARGELNSVAASSIGHFTHEKSPIGAAAALATLDVIIEEKLLERAAKLGAASLNSLRSIAALGTIICDVRGCGMLFGMEIGGGEATNAAERILYACLTRGLSFKVSAGNVLTLAPPLTISELDLRNAWGILADAVAQVRA